ncbi:MAG: Fic family protein [Propionibacteriaceae bacterium]|mgnify:FL=1|nr:Fic family protein [Micropruina sp.]HBX79664.1 Fic family protein [Propionibacteriaceae bacterium]HBY23714.1 Fic family protein [Propionibacteriaceae bacterium]
MDPAKFNSSLFGTVQREPGKKWAFHYFRPAPIPRELELAPRTVKLLSGADAAVGQLEGLCQLVHDPDLLVGPSLRREAVASSRIEGTQASLSDLLQAEAAEGERPSEDVAEVERYLAATRHGYQSIRTLPISQRLLKELHGILLEGVRGAEKLPGELRRSPVWIGATHDNPDSAVFVPPLPDEVPNALADWEDFVNTPGDLPTLIRCGLMHYQFETIHPFLDGNGRIGRLLINLMLAEEGRLSRPLLYVSGYFESHRSEYYHRLQMVREAGQIQEWLQFFLQAVKDQAADANTRSIQLIQIRERYLADGAASRSRLPMLANFLFANPFVTVKSVQRLSGLTNQGARNLIAKAVQRGWLTEVGSIGRGGRTYWVAHEIFQVIDAPMAYSSYHHHPDGAAFDQNTRH